MTLVKGDSTKALAHADRSHTTSGSNISHKEKSRGSLKSAGDHHPNTISKSRATSSGHLDKSKKQKARPKSGFDRSSTPHAKDVKQKHASQPNLSSRGSSHPQTSETKSPSIPPVPTNVGLNRSASDGLVDSVFLTGQEVARQNGDARQGLTEGEPDAVRQTDEKPAGYPRSALKGTRRPSSQPNMRHRSVSLATGLDERGGVASAIVELHQPSNTDEDKPQPGLQHRSQSQRARAKSAVTHRRKSLQDVENSTPTQNLDHSERNVKDSVPLPLTTASNPTIHEASSESSGLSSKKVSVLSLKYSMAELRMELADAETDLSDFQKSIQKIVDPSSAAREGVVKSDLQVNRKTADTRAFSGNSGNDNSQNKLGLYRRYVQSATSLSTHDENMVTVDRAKLRRTKSAVTSISTGARHEHAELVKITAKPTPFAKSNATVTEKSPTTPQLTNSMTQSSGNIGSSPVSPLKDNSTVSLPQVGSLRALTMDKPSDESSTKDNATVVEAAQDVKPTSEVEGVAFQTINALIHPVSEDSPQKGSTEIPPPSVLPQHHVPLTGDEHIQYLIDQLKKQNQHLSSLPISQPSRPPHVGDHDPVAASRTKPHHPDFSVVPLNAQYDVVFATRPRSSSLLKYRERRVITMRALRRLVWAHEMVGERLEGDERVNEKSKTGSLISSRVQSSRSGNSGGTDEKQNEQQEQQQKIQKVDDAKLATELPPPDALKQLQPAVPEPQEPSRATTPPNVNNPSYSLVTSPLPSNNRPRSRDIHTASSGVSSGISRTTLKVQRVTRRPMPQRPTHHHSHHHHHHHHHKRDHADKNITASGPFNMGSWQTEKEKKISAWSLDNRVVLDENVMQVVPGYPFVGCNHNRSQRVVDRQTVLHPPSEMIGTIHHQADAALQSIYNSVITLTSRTSLNIPRSARAQRAPLTELVGFDDPIFAVDLPARELGTLAMF